jgi:hypothetical protein
MDLMRTDTEGMDQVMQQIPYSFLSTIVASDFWIIHLVENRFQ